MGMKKLNFRLGALLVMVATLVIYIAITAVGGEKAAEEARARLEDAVRRAAVMCYAAEGRYPSDIDTLIRDYGLRYDQESYIIWYDFFADNVIPDIEVRARS